MFLLLRQHNQHGVPKTAQPPTRCKFVLFEKIKWTQWIKSTHYYTAVQTYYGCCYLLITETMAEIK